MSDLLLKSLEIEGYRSFRHLRIPQLGRVNLVVGKNNVGKTALLEALRLYADKARYKTVRAILQARNELPELNGQRDYVGEAPFLEVKNLFHGRADLRQTPVAFQIKADDDPARTLAVAIKWYQVTFQDEGPRLLLLQDLSSLGSLANVAAHLEATYDEKKVAAYQLSDPWGLEQQKVEVSKAQFIPTDGLGRKAISELWDQIALTDAEESALQALRLMEPGVQRLNFLARDKNEAVRIPFVKLDGVTEPVHLGSMGEGMSRLLGLAMALASVPNSLLLVDEVETGFHYSILPQVWRLIFETAAKLNVQVFATTHSWDCIEAFQAAATQHPQAGLLARLENREGEVRATLFDEKRLAIATREQIEIR